MWQFNKEVTFLARRNNSPSEDHGKGPIRTAKYIAKISFPRLAMFLAVLCASLNPATAQTLPSPDGQAASPNHPSISVTSRLVVLDVVVTDSTGKIVPHLTKDDFTILQDEQPQRIHSFETWTDRSNTATSPTTDSYGRQDWGDGMPLTIFVLDEMNTPFDEKSFAVENLRSYLRRQPALLASPAMLVTINYTGLNTLSTYTRDRDALLHAIDRRPPTLPAASSRLELVSASFAMLRQIATAAEGIHTHKSIIWLGRGFPALDPADFDDASNLILKKAIQDTVNLLIASRVTLYQVDPITTDARTAVVDINALMAAGGSIDSHITSNGTLDLLDQNFSLNRFVIATGGQLYYGLNDLDNFIADGEQRSVEFYTLSYTPPASADEDIYHSINIQMRNPTWHVSTRQGFYSSQQTPPEPSLRNLGFDLKLASTSAMSYSSVATRIAGAKAAKSSGKLAVSFSVKDSTLQWTPRDMGGDSAKIIVLLVALDKNRDIQSSIATNLNLIVKSSGNVSTDTLETQDEIAVNNKTCSVRLIIRDSSGRIGTADFNHAALAAIPSIKTASKCDRP